MKKNKIKIGVLGAGRIAYSLAPALMDAGYNITCIASRKTASAKKLADACGIKKYSRDLQSLFENDVIFMSVPDDSLAAISEEISRTEANLKGKLFVHLSGSVELKVLSPLRKKGAETASMHIMQTFPKRVETRLDNIPAVVECGKQHEKFFDNLLKDLGLVKISIPAKQKTLYHLGGVFVSNFMIADFLAAEMMIEKSCRSEKNNAIKLFIPIAKSTLYNIENNSLANSLSGPIMRGDIETVEKHIASLKNINKKRSVNIPLFFYLSGCLMLLNSIKRNKKSLSKNQSLIGKILLRELNKSKRQI